MSSATCRSSPVRRICSSSSERRIEMSIGLARFPFVRDLDGFDFAAQPSIDKKQIREIAAGRFIANAEAVLLLGPLGVGKTHLAVAIGRQAILAGYTVLFACGARSRLPRRLVATGELLAGWLRAYR
jgi:DNA replication protein DnaC